jgi:hypothetical protein
MRSAVAVELMLIAAAGHRAMTPFMKYPPDPRRTTNPPELASLTPNTPEPGPMTVKFAKIGVERGLLTNEHPWS